MDNILVWAAVLPAMAAVIPAAAYGQAANSSRPVETPGRVSAEAAAKESQSTKPAARLITRPVATSVQSAPARLAARRPGLIIEFGQAVQAPSGLSQNDADKYAAAYCRSVNYPSGKALDIATDTGVNTRVSVFRVTRLICFD